MSDANLPDFRPGWHGCPALTNGDSEPEDRESPGAKTVEEQARLGRSTKGMTYDEHTCPKCEGEYGNLPLHLVACDGGEV